MLNTQDSIFILPNTLNFVKCCETSSFVFDILLEKQSNYFIFLFKHILLAKFALREK